MNLKLFTDLCNFHNLLPVDTFCGGEDVPMHTARKYAGFECRAHRTFGRGRKELAACQAGRERATSRWRHLVARRRFGGAAEEKTSLEPATAESAHRLWGSGAALWSMESWLHLSAGEEDRGDSE